MPDELCASLGDGFGAEASFAVGRPADGQKYRLAFFLAGRDILPENGSATTVPINGQKERDLPNLRTFLQICVLESRAVIICIGKVNLRNTTFAVNFREKCKFKYLTVTQLSYSA